MKKTPEVRSELEILRDRVDRLSEAIDNPPYLSVKGAAKYSTIAMPTIYAALKTGELESIRVGAKWLTKRPWIDSWLQSLAEVNNS